MQKINPTQTFAWNALAQHKAENLSIQALFAQDPARLDKFSFFFEIKF